MTGVDASGRLATTRTASLKSKSVLPFKISGLAGRYIRGHRNHPHTTVPEHLLVERHFFFDVVQHKLQTKHAAAAQRRLGAKVAQVVAVAQVDTGRPPRLAGDSSLRSANRRTRPPPPKYRSFSMKVSSTPAVYNPRSEPPSNSRMELPGIVILLIKLTSYSAFYPIDRGCASKIARLFYTSAKLC